MTELWFLHDLKKIAQAQRQLSDALDKLYRDITNKGGLNGNFSEHLQYGKGEPFPDYGSDSILGAIRKCDSEADPNA